MEFIYILSLNHLKNEESHAKKHVCKRKNKNLGFKRSKISTRMCFYIKKNNFRCNKYISYKVFHKITYHLFY